VWSQSAVWQPQGATTGNIYYNGGNVGIGTASPSTRLEALQNGFDPGINVGEAGPLNRRATIGFGVNGSTATTGWILGQGLMFNEIKDFYLVDLTAGVTRLYVNTSGNVGIGTTNPQYKLAVEGAIGARDIIVTNTPWSDYVFRPGYHLRPLSEVASFIRQHGHLPEIPSEAEVKDKGVSVAEVQAKLLAKIEELTLHLIQQEKDNRELRDRLTRLETQTGSGSAPVAGR
jgi:hypothetical protein